MMMWDLATSFVTALGNTDTLMRCKSLPLQKKVLTRRQKQTFLIGTIYLSSNLNLENDTDLKP